jgi:hypothetical protein
LVLPVTVSHLLSSQNRGPPGAHSVPRRVRPAAIAVREFAALSAQRASLAGRPHIVTALEVGGTRVLTYRQAPRHAMRITFFEARPHAAAMRVGDRVLAHTA